jgi:hypothetical protein
MLARFSASWLVILILAPFTAPFSICELAGLIETRATHGAPAPTRAHAALVNATHSVTPPPIVRTVSRVKVLLLSARHRSHAATPNVNRPKRTIDPPNLTGTLVTATTVLRL